MVATVLAPDSGGLRLLGLDPADPGERTEIRRRLGYLPQSPGLYPGFTPFDLVDYVAVLKEHTDRDWRREETRRVLESVGLADVMHQKIRRLSGGMKQRVALAAAMVGSPDLLVLDEPANGLDPDQRLQLRSLLTQSSTVLMSTHNISEVAALCQSVYVMFSGRVRFAGTPAELAALAAGRVWEDDPRTRGPSAAGSPRPAPSGTSASRRPGPRSSTRRWTTATCSSRARNTGEPRLAGARPLAPCRGSPWSASRRAWSRSAPFAAADRSLAGGRPRRRRRRARGSRGRRAARPGGRPARGRADLGGAPPRPAPGAARAGRRWRCGWPTSVPRTSVAPQHGLAGRPAVALTATGLAVAVWAPERLAVEAGRRRTAGLGRARPSGRRARQEYGQVLFALQHHPWIVTTAAVAALLMGRNR